MIKRSLKGELVSVTDYPPAQDSHSDSHSCSTDDFYLPRLLWDLFIVCQSQWQVNTIRVLKCFSNFKSRKGEGSYRRPGEAHAFRQEPGREGRAPCETKTEWSWIWNRQPSHLWASKTVPRMQMPHLQTFLHTCLNRILNTLRFWCSESTVLVVQFQNLLKNGEWFHTVYDDGLLFGFLCHLGSETLV